MIETVGQVCGCLDSRQLLLQQMIREETKEEDV
jgi:hypothetical protein